MICNHGKGVLCSLQPIPPLLQSQLYDEQFTVTDVVVSLRRGKLPGVVGTRIEMRRLSVELGQHCSHAGGGGVHFHNEQEIGIWIGVVQKASWSFLKATQASGFQVRDLGVFRSMEVRGAERKLKPWMNLQ